LHGGHAKRNPRNCTAYRTVLLSRPSPRNIFQEAPKAMAVIPAPKLQSIVEETFVKAGCSPEEGERIASHLVMANLSGHDSHGVIRVPVYIGWLKEGLVEANKEVKVVTDTPVLAVVDGQYGFGQSTAPQAVRIGIEKCKAMGLSAVALRNTGHIGRIGAWAEMAAAEDLVSVHFVNAAGSILVAPFGAVERRFSTAPFCAGVPRPGQPPIILDFATSLVAEGKVLVASRGGKALPEDALISADGVIGNDPTLLYGPYEQDGGRNHRLGTGAIRAFGEHKGSGLAFMCELLGGSLTGTGATEEGRRFSNGMLSFYIDPQRLDTAEFFSADIARYVDYVKSAKPVVEGGEVLIPGEPELRSRAKRNAEGVPLADDAWAAIRATARDVGVPEERLRP
jgi:uncharacterized oxidoreductase